MRKNREKAKQNRKDRPAGNGRSVLFSLFLAAVLALSLTACGQTGSAPGNAQGSAAAETEMPAETDSAADARNGETAAAQETADGSAAETEMPEEAQTQAGTEEIREESPVTGATGSFEGIVVDAAMNSLVIAAREGIWYSFSYPESGVETELSEGLVLGMSVLVESEEGIASRILDGPTQPAADRDALTFAADILFACRYESMDSLANLAGFPLYVKLEDGDAVAQDGEEFLALPPEQIFSEERVTAVLSADLYELTELDGGKFVLGSDEGTPNITFQRDEGRDSGFAVTGIN